jgi:hypothetical protein
MTGPRRAGKTCLPGKTGAIALVECKAARTVSPAMALPMQRLTEAVKKKRLRGTVVDMFLAHQQPRLKSSTHAVAPGVRALAWQDFLEGFDG